MATERGDEHADDPRAAAGRARADSRSTFARLVARNVRSSAVSGTSARAAHASATLERSPAVQEAGSAPAATQSASPWHSRRRASRSSRAASIHPRSRGQLPSSASWATSTVGVRLAGSRSNVSRRWRPNSPSTRVELVAAQALLLELGAPDPPAGVLVVLADVDEARGTAACTAPRPVGIELGVDRLGPPADARAASPPDRRGTARVSVVRPSPDSNSSASACCTSGSAPGSPSASAVIRSTKPAVDLHADGLRRAAHRVGQLGGGHRRRARSCGRATPRRTRRRPAAGRSSRRARWPRPGPPPAGGSATSASRSRNAAPLVARRSSR